MPTTTFSYCSSKCAFENVRKIENESAEDYKKYKKEKEKK
jgi:hypothetical protein